MSKCFSYEQHRRSRQKSATRSDSFSSQKGPKPPGTPTCNGSAAGQRLNRVVEGCNFWVPDSSTVDKMTGTCIRLSDWLVVPRAIPAILQLSLAMEYSSHHISGPGATPCRDTKIRNHDSVHAFKVKTWDLRLEITLASR